MRYVFEKYACFLICFETSILPTWVSVNWNLINNFYFWSSDNVYKFGFLFKERSTGSYEGWLQLTINLSNLIARIC